MFACYHSAGVAKARICLDAFWLPSLVESVISRFSERPWLKKKIRMEKWLKKWCACICSCIHMYTYTNKKNNKTSFPSSRAYMIPFSLKCFFKSDLYCFGIQFPFRFLRRSVLSYIVVLSASMYSLSSPGQALFGFEVFLSCSLNRYSCTF